MVTPFPSCKLIKTSLMPSKDSCKSFTDCCVSWQGVLGSKYFQSNSAQSSYFSLKALVLFLWWRGEKKENNGKKCPRFTDPSPSPPPRHPCSWGIWIPSSKVVLTVCSREWNSDDTQFLQKRHGCIEMQTILTQSVVLGSKDVLSVEHHILITFLSFLPSSSKFKINCCWLKLSVFLTSK